MLEQVRQQIVVLDGRVDDHEKRIGKLENLTWKVLAAATVGGILGKGGEWLFNMVVASW